MTDTPAGAAPLRERIRPPVSARNDDEAIRWLKSRHDAPCGQEECDSVYCLYELAESRRAANASEVASLSAALEAAKQAVWSYGSHRSDCQRIAFGAGTACSCGYFAAAGIDPSGDATR